ncbi:LysR family transcriptional regulator [Neorhizobium sp. NCHU2750]|uniref:LysR family transcriptional regulator n=1 Tax=Neorhizobium sp. NCHU2750 TaxID=1825976 RepID=UPI000E76127E|nr:transcriptional regulator [Neorhizobium sp. NCHU2750]AYD04849.1 transcriptional regulator [Neorhizobium sp. NCHU2750]
MQTTRDFDLADLDAFIAVCETGSMTEAARRLGLTESAVSHLIRRMEKRMGVTLFDRSFRPLKTTVLGTQLFSRGQQLLQDATGINQELRTKGRVKHAHLSIGVIETLGTWFATNLIEQLAANSRSWTVASGSNAELWERFYARELSALIVLDDDERRDGATKFNLLTESVVLITPPLLSHLSLGELAAGVPMVGANRDSGFGRLVAAYLSRLKIDATPTATFDILDSVLMTVAHGFGWALVPSLLLLRETPERHQVNIRPIEKSAISRRITLATRQYELGALTDLIQQGARQVFDSQLLRTRHQHPELFSKLSFVVDP